MLDTQTPNIKVIAYRDNDIDDEASINPYTDAQTQKHKRDIIPFVKTTRPSQPHVRLQPWSKRVEDAEYQWQDQNVGVRKGHFRQMCSDDL